MLDRPRPPAYSPGVHRLLAAGLVLAAVACQPPPTAACGGACGPGTECIDNVCVPVAPAAEPEPTPKKGKKGKRGRKNRSSEGGAAADGGGGAVVGDAGDSPIADDPPPPYVPVDDSKIPDFSDAEPQVLDLKAGSERLEERTLDQHFARVTPEIQRCVTTASRYGEIGAGSLKFKLRVLPSGKVESVTLTAPASLRVWSIPACARKAVYQHRFPSFDGPAMAVSFSIDID